MIACLVQRHIKLGLGFARFCSGAHFAFEVDFIVWGYFLVAMGKHFSFIGLLVLRVQVYFLMFHSGACTFYFGIHFHLQIVLSFVHGQHFLFGDAIFICATLILVHKCAALTSCLILRWLGEDLVIRLELGWTMDIGCVYTHITLGLTLQLWDQSPYMNNRIENCAHHNNLVTQSWKKC